MQPTRERDLPTVQERHVMFDLGLSRTLVKHLSSVGRQERGGLMLGRRDRSKIRVTAVVLPPQRVQAADHCVFDVRSIETIRNAASTLDNRLKRNIATIVGWVHTHPRLGLFLSHVDVDTFATWRQLDEEALAVVVDPFLGPTDTDRIAFWRAERPEVPDVSFRPPPAERLTFQDGTAIAQAIFDAAPSPGAWEIVTPWNVVNIYPPRRPAPTSIGGER